MSHLNYKLYCIYALLLCTTCLKISASDSLPILLRLHYKHLYVPDTTNGNKQAWREMMVLDILKDSAVFYPKEMVEKLLLAEKNKDKIEAIYATGVVNGADLAPYRYSGLEILMRKNTTRKQFWYTFYSVKTFEYTEESMYQQWEIVGDSVKTLLGYTCYLARTTFRGRTWEAWFTYDIPATTGPWKFHGLPGAIVRVKDTRNHFLYELTGVEANLPFLFDVSLITSQPEKAKKITAAEMQDILKLHFEDIRTFNRTISNLYIDNPNPIKGPPRYYNPMEFFDK
ncbi:MAG: GLPGLI family protein [Lacibacter sp.]